MRALKCSSTAVLDSLLSRQDLDINIQTQARESALWYTIYYETSSTAKSVLQLPNVRVDTKHKHGRMAPPPSSLRRHNRVRASDYKFFC